MNMASICELQARQRAAWAAGVRGGQLLVGADTIDAEIGRIERERDTAAERLRQLKDLRRRVR